MKLSNHEQRLLGDALMSYYARLEDQILSYAEGSIQAEIMQDDLDTLWELIEKFDEAAKPHNLAAKWLEKAHEKEAEWVRENTVSNQDV